MNTSPSTPISSTQTYSLTDPLWCCAAGVQGDAEGRQPGGGEGAAGPELHLARRVRQGGRPAEDAAQQQHRAVPGALSPAHSPQGCRDALSQWLPVSLPVHRGLDMTPLTIDDSLCRAPVSRRTRCCSSQSSWMVRTSFPVWHSAYPSIAKYLCTQLSCASWPACTGALLRGADAPSALCMVQAATCSRPLHGSRSPGSCGARLWLLPHRRP